MDEQRRLSAGLAEWSRRLPALLLVTLVFSTSAAVLLWSRCLPGAAAGRLQLPAAVWQSERPAAAEVARLMTLLGRPADCELSPLRVLLPLLALGCAAAAAALRLSVCRPPPLHQQLLAAGPRQDRQPLLDGADVQSAGRTPDLRGEAGYGTAGAGYGSLTLSSCSRDRQTSTVSKGKPADQHHLSRDKQTSTV